MAHNASGRSNRVAPDGSFHDVADRGLLWGNRGQLLDAHGELARSHRGRLWIICVLEFHGRHRTQWQPNRLTELYLLDEATGLAAGHRPCGECRHHAYQQFKAAWLRAFGLEATTRASEIDRALHSDRIDESGRSRTYRDRLAELPDGVMVELDGSHWLVRGEHLHRWTFRGYEDATSRRDFPGRVAVRTPRATVAVLREGYRPLVHPSARV